MTQQAQTIQGSIVAIVTPMFEDGSVDWKGLEKLVEWHIAEGTNSIVAVGTTGEASTLSMSEHTQVIKEIIRVANKRIPIIAGTGANSTREAIQLTREAKELGADAALLVTPYYNKPTQEGLYQHYKAVAEAVDLPQILYNVPGRTGVDMLNETVIRLADIPQIVGIKDATGDVPRGAELLQGLKDKDMVVYSGDDATAYQLMGHGAKGNISVTANVAPKAMSEVCAAAITGNATDAEQLNAQVANLHNILFCESNPIPVKWALHDMGLIGTGIRLPLTPLAEQYRAPLHEALVEAGVIK
ncbi:MULTISPECIES: 4-hydroxy-tetrahydrodipicolinate synthase [Acinetobacter]|jgi:4-hydroxy-tetrahydrodipicolinate synthase|uniref:4-hydroxy-tetrahydrodipicolinate synthase n=1 Tax=Acinetobacter pseudolwoffii TaxID=2053287 RepID=N9M602_9GAMM|nr:MULTISPECIES: 4-hydroxy-tetrahydrodipicolinate synthase [Acinetobacter]ENW85769.1 dihydrodipicolinate synthase [Acinetobacter pseudolwoffii]MCO8090987.1 4-hydroxy-tetrahydrodipicolinate synthase [Acinetobacter pseudolwoffii]MDH5820551.1 4-hydroxy-tetrahydrodipicolinate synthase [Acinetobacter pseudolwoffii]MDM1324849.1 4-hydroxy-tetrahydrodipicolinate synthase [Acinetobacter pseudolwoffii]MDM1341083.1 4-hydroxy-tetrahydrodipicolinate synthase [Acinetobacter pseudolwoffii]